MRFLPLGLLLLAALCLPAGAATRIDDPEKFIAQQYDALKKDHGHRFPNDIYSARLAALFAADMNETGAKPPEFGRLDFNFWVDAQDTDDAMPGVVKITSEETPHAPDRRIVEVTFTNFDPKDTRFYFEKTPQGWKLDDVSSPTGGWTLSLILKYGR